MIIGNTQNTVYKDNLIYKDSKQTPAMIAGVFSLALISLCW
jgi:hypothetical protein